MYKDNILLDNSEITLNTSNIKNEEEITNNISVTDIELNLSEARKINKGKGKYITIKFNKEKIDNELEILLNTISDSFKKILKYYKITKVPKVLFVGLGNKDFACDKFGSTIIEKICLDDNSYKIYKNVLGSTNIKSTDFIRNLTGIIDVDLVVVFDSLKAESTERLGKTIQIATTGLSPGSAFSKKASIIDQKTIKKPVINVGIPTIINIKKEVGLNEDLIVTTNDIDMLVDNLSTIISISINRIF